MSDLLKMFAIGNIFSPRTNYLNLPHWLWLADHISSLATNVKVTADIFEFEILTMISSFRQTFPKYIMSVEWP